MGIQKTDPERRKFLRIHEEDVLVCEPFDASVLRGDSGKRRHVVSKDLSQGGLLFESREPFEIGTILKLQVDIPGWEKFKTGFIKVNEISGRHPLVTLGKVVRVEDVGAGNFDIGIAFVALDSGHKLALQKYLEKVAHRGEK
ncbi:MAG: PilZ domain-containing protein [Candidatus Omnitrophota bacterium]